MWISSTHPRFPDLVLRCSVGVLLWGTTASGTAGVLHGQVTDRESGDPLPAANVSIAGTTLGTTTDKGGHYALLHIPPGNHTVRFSFLGYAARTIPLFLNADDDTVSLNVDLSAVPVAIAGSFGTEVEITRRLDQPVARVDAAAIDRRNATTVDDAIRHVPGVNMTEFQVNIRGSSGYAKGVGSRVLMMVDDVPMTTGDTGELNFEMLPIGQVEWIDVIKGASSALYGSGALGGVISVHTKNPGEIPETRVRTYAGAYGGPSFPSWKWGDDRARLFDGESFSHARRFGDLGMIIAGSRASDDGYRQNDFRRRYGGYVKLSQPLSSSMLTGSFNYFHQKRGSFLYWKDLRRALIPPDVEQGDIVESSRFFLNGRFTGDVSDNLSLTVTGSWFSNRWDDTIDTLTNSSRSDVVRGEVRVQAGGLTAGVAAHTDRVNADIFGRRAGNGLAPFLQVESRGSDGFKFWIGLRYDVESVDSLSTASQFNPKIGVTFTPMPTMIFRGYVSRGFRTPSVAESFVRTRTAGVDLVPNPGLQPERSWTYEVSVSRILSEHVVADLALFRTDYRDLIEAGFTPAGTAQFDNVSDATVSGAEVTAELRFLRGAWTVDAGYTYVYPRDNTRNDILRYRPRHVVQVNNVIDAGIVSGGIDYRFISRVDRIDDEFVLLGIVPDGQERVPIHVVDARIGVDIPLEGLRWTVSLAVNNLLQYNYVELIGNIAPPRSFSVVLNLAL